MRVDLLCSGSKGNACLVRDESTTLMIDCGPGTWRYLKGAMQDAGVQTEDLNALLITHSHKDHIRQLSHFDSMPIYTCCPLSVKKRGQAVELDLRNITPPARFTIGTMSVLALPTSHDSGPSMGFVIESQGEKLVYITDTGYIPESHMSYIEDADYYVFESNYDLEKLNETERPLWLKLRIASDTGHLENRYAAHILRECVTKRTRQIVLAHLSEEANSPTLALRTLFEQLEFSHYRRPDLSVIAAEQFVPVHFGSIRKGGDENEKNGSVYTLEDACQSAQDERTDSRNGSELAVTAEESQTISDRAAGSAVQPEIKSPHCPSA